MVGELRLAHDPSAALGVPAHVTVLFPFVPAEQVDDEAVAAFVSRFPAFDFSLDRLERFDDGVVWLHPHPSERFVDLTAAVWQRWPAHPPYEGAFDEVIPHVTVSMQPLELALALPVECRAREVLLLEEEEPGGRWHERLRVPLLDQPGGVA